MIVYTGGTFDVPHIGHVHFLYECAKFGEVTVALNTDEFIAEYKGQPPIYTYEERRDMLKLLPYVKNVIPNIGGSDSKPAILSVKPDIIVVGSDWARRDYYKQMEFDQDWLDVHHISVMYVPYTKNVSTTDIKRRIRERYSSSDNSGA